MRSLLFTSVKFAVISHDDVLHAHWTDCILWLLHRLHDLWWHQRIWEVQALLSDVA